jgi:hypothetical protein
LFRTLPAICNGFAARITAALLAFVPGRWPIFRGVMPVFRKKQLKARARPRSREASVS